MKPSVILAIAVVALVLGAFGLYVGLSAKDAAAKLDLRIADVQQLAQTATTAAEQAGHNTDKLRADVQNKLTEVMSDMAAQQQQISDITNKTIKVKEPKGEKQAEPKKGEKMAKPANGIYISKKGDTVKSIANQYGIKQHLIYEANPTLEADKQLKAGTKVNIP